jgi:predicted acylesterase/phospholipase RssA
MYWASNVALRFRFAAVFQGGGIRGLFFPGHLVGLVRRGIEKIFVYAGASAGALIAVGIWAGLQPRELNAFLVTHCGRFGLVRSMFSVGDLFAVVATWVWAIILVPLNSVLKILTPLFLPGILFFFILLVPINFAVRILMILCVFGILVFFFPRLLRLQLAFPLECYPGCPGTKFERLINKMILEGLAKRGIHPQLIEDLLETTGEFWPTFRDIWRLSHWVRLVNGVTGFEHPDYEKVEAFYPVLKERRREVRFTSETHNKNNIWQLVYGLPTYDPFFAPIFISTCCVDDRMPVLFNNIEERYWDIPIAHIVRASAGYPTVFRPKALTVDNNSKRYTDGGLMANFPAFAVNQALRQLFSRTNEQLPEDYKTIRTLPFGTIGLAVSDEAGPSTYMAVLRDVLLGGARERLEYELASTSPYFRLVRQRTTGEPHFLNFFSVKPTLIELTFAKASSYIDGIKISSTVDLDPLRGELERNLNGAISTCERLFSIRNGGYVRSHLFFEADTKHGLFDKKAVICKGREIDKFRDIEVSVPKEFGLHPVQKTPS